MSAIRQTKKWRGMCVVAEFTPEEILPLRGDREETFYAGDFPYSVHMDSQRYRVFAKSLVCCECGLTGCVMRLEYSYHERGHFRPHFNLYAINPDDGTYILMTKDHIIPRSKGGSLEDENLRTMCSPCNAKKGDKIHVEAGGKYKPVPGSGRHSSPRALRQPSGEGQLVLDDSFRYHPPVGCPVPLKIF